MKKLSTNLIKSLPSSAASFNWEPIKLGVETAAHPLQGQVRRSSDFSELWPSLAPSANAEPLLRYNFPSVPSNSTESEMKETTPDKKMEVNRLLGINQSSQVDAAPQVFSKGFDELKIEPVEPELPKIELAELIKLQKQVNKDRKVIKELLDEAVRNERRIVDEAHRQAEEIVNEAQARAEAMIRDAEQALKEMNDQKQEIENQVEQIRSAAFEEGLDEGKREALQIIQSAGSVLTESENWWKNMISQSEPQIVQTILAIAQKMFGGGVELDTHALKEVVGRAIEEASRLGNVRVYLHPEDANKLIALWQDSEIMYNGQKIELIPNQNILPGGCYLEGEFGSVDSRVESQLRLIQDSMNKTLINNRRENENG